MTENNKPKNDGPQGFDDLTGPAAFKAQILREQELAEPDITETSESVIEPGENIDTSLFTGRISELEATLAQAKDQLLRTVAEMENLRKRSQREREDAGKYAVSSFAKDLLDVADTFRRALSAIPQELRAEEKIKPLVEGIEATERALLKTFEKNGIKRIEPLDEPFNPNFHEVMFEAVVAGKPAGMIIQLIEAGYMLNDRLLRPARVGVAKADLSGDGTAHNVDTSA